MRLELRRGKSRIVPKRDFGSGPGWFDRGRYTKSGFVVINDGCNYMPGAIWFHTVAQAVTAIEVFTECAKLGLDSDEFYRRYHLRLAANPSLSER